MSRVRSIDLLPGPTTYRGSKVYIYRALIAVEHEWREKYYTADEMAELLALILEDLR